MGKSPKKVTDRSILDQGVEYYEDVLSPQQSRLWYGSFVLGWQNDRLAKALHIDTKTVRSTLYEARKVVTANPSIAYRSIEGLTG